MVDQKEPMAEKCECDHSRSEHADTGKGPGQGHCRHEKGNGDAEYPLALVSAIAGSGSI